MSEVKKTAFISEMSEATDITPINIQPSPRDRLPDFAGQTSPPCERLPDFGGQSPIRDEDRPHGKV